MAPAPLGFWFVAAVRIYPVGNRKRITK